MKLGIVGSRTFNDLERAIEVVQNLPFFNQIDTIVSGGARGADSIAEQIALHFNWKMIIHRPEWYCNGKYNPSAGMKRNTLIVDESDVIIAFWNRVSKGTADTIKKARARSIPVIIEPFSAEWNK